VARERDARASSRRGGPRDERRPLVSFPEDHEVPLRKRLRDLCKSIDEQIEPLLRREATDGHDARPARGRGSCRRHRMRIRNHTNARWPDDSTSPSVGNALRLYHEEISPTIGHAAQKPPHARQRCHARVRPLRHDDLLPQSPRCEENKYVDHVEKAHYDVRTSVAKRGPERANAPEHSCRCRKTRGRTTSPTQRDASHRRGEDEEVGVATRQRDHGDIVSLFSPRAGEKRPDALGSPSREAWQRERDAASKRRGRANPRRRARHRGR